jgi:hypothetical protein
VAENVSEPIMLLSEWGIGMDPTTLGLRRWRWDYSSVVLYALLAKPGGGGGNDNSWRICSDKGVRCPTGKSVKSLSTFKLNAEFWEGKGVEMVIWSITGTDYISFWRNRDMDLVQGPVDCLK